MKNQKIIAVFLLSLIAGVAQADSAKVSQSNESAASKGVKASVSMPTSAMITDAMRPFRLIIGPSFQMRLLERRFAGDKIMMQALPFLRPPALEVIASSDMRAFFIDSFIDTTRGPMQLAESMQSRLTDLTADKFLVSQFTVTMAPLAPDFQPVPAEAKLIDEEKNKCAKLGTKEGKSAREKAEACWWHFHLVSVSAEAIVAAHTSIPGWEVEVMNPNTDKDKKALNNYIFGNMMVADYANMIEGEIAGKISGVVMKNPAVAKLKIQRVLFKIPTQTFVAASGNAQKIAESNWQNLMIDMASGKGIGWTAGGSLYHGDTAGLHIERNGVEWFGAGNINGKKYALGLESAISSSATEKKSSEISEGAPLK